MLERIKKEMIVDTHYTDTHPSLKDRVMALGAATPQIPESPGISAAEAWLGAGNQKIMADPRMAEIMDMENPLFDCQRMAYGGFQELVP